MGRTFASNTTPVPESTLTELLFDSYDRHRGQVAFQRMPAEGVLEDITFDDAMQVVRNVAASLDEAGVAKGDRVAILSENRPEWAFVDYGCLCAGVIPVPIYPTSTPPQIAYLLRDSGARVVFASTTEQLVKVQAAAEEVGELSVVVFDSSPDTGGASESGAAAGRGRVLGWDDFLERGRERTSRWSEEAFRARALEARPHEVATILYTSGTTGEPKGVMLTHNNVASNVRASRMVLEVTERDNTVSFLPLSHILQRMVDYLFMWVGCRIAYPRDVKTLVDDLKVIRPTVVVSVPRIYEKIYNGVMSASGPKKALIDWAVGIADRAADRRLAGEPLPKLLRVRYALADRLVYGKVKAAVGGRLRFFVSGGGPLAPTLNRFFYSIGLTILEGYGLTETSPVTNVNTERDFRIGTVGKPVPSTEIRIAEDGEIFVRGPQVMKGYYRRPEDTAAAIDADGWFATGDIGALDDDGFLSITDRKKEIIVTAGGKNIAPQPIENRLKTHPLVEQVVMIGDRRRYPVVLIVPNFDALEKWAAGRGLRWRDRAELVGLPEVFSHMESETLGSLSDLARYEQPKKMALLHEELTVENGFLTPSLKIKRRVVDERLDHVIDSLYAEEPFDATENTRNG